MDDYLKRKVFEEMFKDKSITELAKALMVSKILPVSRASVGMVDSTIEMIEEMMLKKCSKWFTMENGKPTPTEQLHADIAIPENLEEVAIACDFMHSKWKEAPKGTAAREV